jgi:hypothetical protein
MTEYRLTRPGDEARLRWIWTEAYEGDGDSADLYLQNCYRPGDGMAAEVDGALCSVIYLVDGFLLHFPGQMTRTCTYLYALGTPKEYRGHGYGGKTIWNAGVEGYRRGADCVCLLPASDGLYQWYEDILGSRPVFFRRAFSVARTDQVEGQLTRISPEHYAETRETLLKDTPHAQCPMNVVQLQGSFCDRFGGGLFRVSVDGREGVCAVDREGDKLLFHELLFPTGDPRQAAQAVIAALNAAEGEARVPAFWHDGLGEIQPDNVLFPGGVTFPKTEKKPYWGLALD